MTIDNSELIKPFLNYVGDDGPYFYSAEVIKRRKDNPEMTSGTRVIDSFYVCDGEFDDLFIKMKLKAEQNNARVYIQLNKKSSRMVALRAMRKMAENIERGDYAACKRSYQSAAGETCSAGDDKLWLVDLDAGHLCLRERIEDIVQKCFFPRNAQMSKNGCIQARLPTVNGIHLICKPFNRELFRKKWDAMYVELNLPANLTMPDVGKVGQGTLLYYKGA